MSFYIKRKLKSMRKSIAKKFLDKKNRRSNIFDIGKVKSILFFRNDDKIGDMVVSTLIFREIKKYYPNIKIIVLCGKNNAEILKYNRNVDEIYTTRDSFLKDLSIYVSLRKQRISLGIDFYTFGHCFISLLILRIVNVSTLVGFYKDSYNIYDLSINKDFFNEHISKRYEHVLKILGIDNPNLDYDIFTSSKEDSIAIELLKKSNSKYNIVLNPFAASKHRSFSFDKLQSLVSILEKQINCSVFIINYKNNNNLLTLKNDKTFICRVDSVLKSASLIKYADAVITPDTSIVHIAAAFNKKTVAFYLDYSKVSEKINVIWAPNNKNAISISVDAKDGLKSDIKNISNLCILDAVKKLL
ncbi:MAG: glycosyltransferase family 9 protein [Endomicrobium sp.]|jgi:ADP-heptose:LPS heptosyltransferase|uniref:glycosyltransferase family 9 protein n=1 Tax=Candidatus Endomicrobiellum cubanum TaxID=3242325 RepID=UPI002821C0F6|nr:glycosyltransferase family 9 protein [Endomicrobium sp.]